MSQKQRVVLRIVFSLVYAVVGVVIYNKDPLFFVAFAGMIMGSNYADTIANEMEIKK